jgi:hypothetical protein
VKKLEAKDCSLKCDSKEAHAYMPHPLYMGVDKNFSKYASTMMLHQLIESYKFIG